MQIKWKTQRNLIHGGCDPKYSSSIYAKPTIYPTYFEQNSGIVDWGSASMKYFFNWGSCSVSNLAMWQSTLQDSSGNLLSKFTYNPTTELVDTISTSGTTVSTDTCTINIDTSRATSLTFTSYKLTCWSKVYGNNFCQSPNYCISEDSVDITVQIATSSFGCSQGSNIQQLPVQVSYPTAGITVYQHWGQTDPNLNQYYFDIDLTTLFTFSDTNCMKNQITSCVLEDKQGPGPNDWVAKSTSNKYRIYLDTSNAITAQSIRIKCSSATGAIESYPQLWTVVAFTCSNVFTFTIKNYVFIIDDTNYQQLFATYGLYVSSSDNTKCPVSSLTIMIGTSTTQIQSQTTGQLIFLIPTTVGIYNYTIQVCDYRKEACKTSNNYTVTILCGSPTASSIATQYFQLGSMVTGVLATVGTSYMTITDPSNCLLTYTITTQEYSTDNTIWKTSTDISIEDSTTGGRVLLTLPSQIYYYRYKIKATRQTDSTKYVETNYNYVQMTCGPLSSVLQDQEKVYEYSLVQKVTSKNTLNFDQFICNPNVCCDKPITYQFYQYPWQSSSTISTNMLTAPVETISGSNKYKYVVDVSLPRVIEFYIFGINSYGIKGFSTKIKITIIGECILNKVSYNTLQPASISDHQNYLNFSYSNPDNVPYLWLQYEQAYQKNQESYDMSSRFFSSTKGCSLYYSIIKILDYSRANAPVSIADYINNIFLDQDKGILTFQYFQRPVNYLIYMKAVDLGNSQSSPITDYHVNLTVYPKNAKIPNNPPIFQYQAPDITQDIGTYDDEGNLIEPGAEKVIVYKLPPVYDRELKPVNLSLGGLTPWMKYYPDNNSIVVDLDSANFTYVANFRILFKLSDPEGLSSQGFFNINLIPKAVRNKTNNQILKDSKKWICSVSPKIYQVTEDGLLIIKFNMTMMTDFDHRLINSKTTKIYILPAMGRDKEEFFDKTQLAFDWTLLEFEKDTMFIQLYFEKSCEISPLDSYDKIAIDFSSVQQLLYSGKYLSGVYDISTFSGIQRRLYNKELSQKITNGDICPLTVFQTDSILPRQMDLDSRYSADSFSDFFAIVFIFCFIIGIIIGMFISDTIWVLLSSVRYLQICLHLPMLKTIFPSNVLRFMRKTLPLAHFDVANLIWLNFKQTVLSEQNKIFESDQSRYLGYNDFTILNQTLKYALLLYIIFAIIYFLFSFLIKLTFFQNLKAVEKYKDNKYILLFFNFFHQLILFKILMFLGLFGFMEYLIQLIYIFSPHYTKYQPSGGHKFLAVLGLILIFFVLPIVYLYGYRIHFKITNENKIEQAEIYPINDEGFEEEEITKQRNQSLPQGPYPNSLDQTYDKIFPQQISSNRPLSDKEEVLEGGDQEYYQNIWQRQQKIKQDYLSKVGMAYYQIKDPQLDQFFYIFCIIRRIIYVLIVFCAKNQSIQLWWMISVNFLSVCYVGFFRPMKTDLQNNIEYFNQLSAALVTVHLLYFAGLGALDCSQKSGFGWSLIVIVSFNCIMCLLSTILRLLEILKLFLIKCWTKNKIKKLKELLEQLKKIQEEQERQAEIEANDPLAEEKKIETMKSEGYSAAYILMQTVNKDKNKKRKIRQLVTLNMDKVKGDNGLKEIVELADEENSNGSLEQAIYQDEPNQPKIGLSDEISIQDDGKQFSDEKSSESEEIQKDTSKLKNQHFPDLIIKPEDPYKHTCPPWCKKDDENHNCDDHHGCLPGECFCFDRVNFNGYKPKNKQKQKKIHTCPPTCDRNENNHDCDSHHSCKPPKCKGHGHEKEQNHMQVDQINSGKEDQTQNSNNGNDNETHRDKNDNDQNNDEDEFADNGPLYYDFGGEEIPVQKEAPKIKFSPRESQMVTEGASRILIQENSSRLMNLNDSTFSFIEKQKSDLSESVNSDLFEKVNAQKNEKKIQKKQFLEEKSTIQLSSQGQVNQTASNLSTYRLGQDDNSQINPSPSNSTPKNSQQIKEKKKQKSEKSSSNSSFEDNGPIYYDFDN